MPDAVRGDSKSNRIAGLSSPGKIKRFFFALLAIVLGLALIEGLASLGLFGYDLIANRKLPLAERRHTQYDATLGWVNIPGIVVKDMYGPGRTLTINQQGFRAATDYSRNVPPGKTRIMCTGDSFAFGYGVGDDETFCEQIARFAPRFQVINMGQGGYGLDQSYLWYERDGFQFDHNVHLVCLGWLQFDRMFNDEFMGYGKPTLILEGGRVVANHVPVAERAYYTPWITQNARLLQSSRTVQLISRMTGSMPVGETPELNTEQVFSVSIAAVESMRTADRRHGSGIVIAWLPTPEECRSSQFEGIRMNVLTELRDRGFEVIDLLDAFRLQPQHVIDSFFIRQQDAAAKYPSSVGHYTAEGNAFVAEQLSSALVKLLEVDE